MCVNSKRRQREWISRRLDVEKEIPKDSDKTGKRKSVSKQIPSTKNKCTSEKTAWIPLWCHSDTNSSIQSKQSKKLTEQLGK